MKYHLLKVYFEERYFLLWVLPFWYYDWWFWWCVLHWIFAGHWRWTLSRQWKKLEFLFPNGIFLKFILHLPLSSKADFAYIASPWGLQGTVIEETQRRCPWGKVTMRGCNHHPDAPLPIYDRLIMIDPGTSSVYIGDYVTQLLLVIIIH